MRESEIEAHLVKRVRELGGAWRARDDIDLSWLPRIERLLGRAARPLRGASPCASA